MRRKSNASASSRTSRVGLPSIVRAPKRPPRSKLSFFSSNRGGVFSVPVFLPPTALVFMEYCPDMAEYVLTPESKTRLLGTQLMEELHRRGFPVEINLKGQDQAW